MTLEQFATEVLDTVLKKHRIANREVVYLTDEEESRLLEIYEREGSVIKAFYAQGKWSRGTIGNVVKKFGKSIRKRGRVYGN